MQLKQTHQVVWRNPRKITKKTKTRFQISTYLEFSSPGAKLAPLFASFATYSKGGRTWSELRIGKYLLQSWLQQMCPPKESFESCGAKWSEENIMKLLLSSVCKAVCKAWGKFFPLALDHPKKIPERGLTSRILEWVSTGETFAARIRLMRAWPTSNICWKRL